MRTQARAGRFLRLLIVPLVLAGGLTRACARGFGGVLRELDRGAAPVRDRRVS